MNIKEIRSKSDAELLKAVEDMKNELYDLRFQRATGNIENPMKMREIKKSIARIKTILKERELAKKED